MAEFDVIIIGSGPAGLSAGIYTSRAGLRTLVCGGTKWGGQLMQTTLVENFPGFPDGIQGPDLMTNMRKQAENFGVRVIEEDVTAVDFSKWPLQVGANGAKAIIIATGAEFRWLGIPGEQKLIGRGVSACATCDAAFFKNKKVIVVGGGDAAMEEALVLAKFASGVTLVHRRDSFRASKIMQERVLSDEKIKVMWNTEVMEILGESKVEGVRLRSVVDRKEKQTEIDGVFVAIGHTPATKIFEGKVDLDAKSYMLRKGQKYRTMSNIDGVFVAGDVHDYVYRQAITAAGYGVEAALDCERWLDELSHKNGRSRQ